MKLTTAKTTRYGDLRVKVSNGTATPADIKAYEGLVREMGKPEPRKPRSTKAKAAPAAGAAAAAKAPTKSKKKTS